MSRYTNEKIVNNDSDFYSPLLEKRGLKSIAQLRTVVLKNPEIFERAGLETDTYIWKYGDRYYKLAFEYYNDPKLWWIIAWYNGYPTEANIKIGDVIDIPLSLEEIIQTLGL
jgi:nucleoid-associated protein YgaU